MKLNTRLLKEARHTQTTLLLSICLGSIGGVLSVFQAYEMSKVINQVFLEGKTLESVSILLFTILMIVMLRVGFVWGGETRVQPHERLNKIYANNFLAIFRILDQPISGARLGRQKPGRASWSTLPLKGLMR
jgi:ABC-type transport system involved in cytochrome bd biosynthesis fused ATPase/permease subunit